MSSGADPPEGTRLPLDPTHALARKNMIWGWALFAGFWVLFVGTVVVAFIYLAVVE